MGMEGPPSTDLSRGVDQTEKGGEAERRIIPIVTEVLSAPKKEGPIPEVFYNSNSSSRADVEHQPSNDRNNKILQKWFTLFNYSPLTTFIMLGMVVAGAGRSVAVKAYFQIGFKSPMLVTMLYLIGAFLCIIPYYIALLMDKYVKYRATNKRQKDNNSPRDVSGSDNARVNESRSGVLVYEGEEGKEPIQGDDDGDRREISSGRDDDDGDTFPGPIHYVTSSTAGSHLSLISLALSHCSSRFNELSAPVDGDQSIEMEQRVVSSASGIEGSEQAAIPSSSRRSKDLLTRRSSSSRGALASSTHQHHHWTEGSRTGLTRESEKRVSKWVNRIPHWCKPVLPGLCNVIKSFLRWAALIYASASVAEILISGLELVFIVFAARIVRKRMVSKLRWLGVVIVCVGIVIVGCTDVLGSRKKNENNDENDETSAGGAANQLIGIALIVGQCVVSVVQDILEEIFVQVGDFPALLLVSVEGLVGVLIGLALYYPAARVLNENLRETWNTLTSSKGNIGFIVGLTLLFMVAHVFNILACAATSAMTRNMWGNLRTTLVWVFGLIIYYSSAGGNNIGEPWLIPDSFIILVGFGVILYGLQVYYKE